MAEGPEKVFVVVKFVEGDYEVVSKHWLRFDKSDKKMYCWFPTIPDTVGKLLEKHPQTFLDTDGDRGAVHLYPLDHPPYPGHYFVEYRDAVAKMKLIVDNSKYNSDPEGGSSRRERKTLNRYAADDFNTKRRRETANSQACDNDGVEKGSESDSDSDIARKLAIDVKVNFADLGMSNADSTWFDTGGDQRASNIALSEADIVLSPSVLPNISESQSSSPMSTPPSYVAALGRNPMGQNRSGASSGSSAVLVIDADSSSIHSAVNVARIQDGPGDSSAVNDRPDPSNVCNTGNPESHHCPTGHPAPYCQQGAGDFSAVRQRYQVPSQQECWEGMFGSEYLTGNYTPMSGSNSFGMQTPPRHPAYSAARGTGLQPMFRTPTANDHTHHHHRNGNSASPSIIVNHAASGSQSHYNNNPSLSPLLVAPRITSPSLVGHSASPLASLPFTHAGAAANSGFGYNIFPKALNGIAANPANSRPDSESQSASGFISLTALVSDAVKNSSGTAACSDQKSQKSSFKVSACIPASSSETVDSESISNEIASVRAEVHAIKAMLNSQPTPLTGGSREFQLLRQKQDYQTELLLHVLKKLDDVITRVPLPPGVLPSVVEPLPTAPTIDDITVTFVDSPVTVVLPMRKIEELTDFHSQLTGNTRITMVTRLVLKCRDKHESVVDATNAVCEAVFHNELRAKISYFGTGVQIAAKWTQADRDKKFRLSMKEIDTDQRIEDMLSDVVAEVCAAPDRGGNRSLTKDQKTMFRSSLIEYLRRGRERGTTGTTNREARRTNHPGTHKPRKPKKKKSVPVEGSAEVEASNKEKAPATLEGL